MTERMRAITMWQPWAHDVVHGDKNIENRTTLLPPAALLVEPRPFFAIHAGLKYGMLGYEFPPGYTPAPQEDVTFGAVIGVARVLGALDMRNPSAPRVVGAERTSTLLSSPEYNQLLNLAKEAYWLGPIGWLLADRCPITPLPCRGSLGCWSLTADQTVVVRAHHERALYVASRRVLSVAP